ncbi:YbaK/EbsC family protein [Sphingomonas astaxanthinifaciens]|uniref:Cys-tRNA(Pro)/cys-tRNA(Cys) deacylase n=1 Tax=Sphingomonas astaxanthinifaciens DSM 22298 TaxID=1123267 RepID=A0ABQ5Z7K5_9SPHN|nr:YbaK/EbsC family protein [Sphingomonas astaxanthinifaciens]GLR47985.1 cys-tRNA(pro)/cys-tRNA(cys) deacylase [Sphingomonas astaxanthinifaciens DSM 22298]
MSLASVRAWVAAHAPDLAIIEGHGSTATVADAAATLGVEPGRIAKTIALKVGEKTLLLVTRGDARLDNLKCKAAFGGRIRMLDPDATFAATGHVVGGVCPFGLATPLPVYTDVSLRAFATVFPAAGSRTASLEITPERLAELTHATWVDCCTLPQAG